MIINRHAILRYCFIFFCLVFHTSCRKKTIRCVDAWANNNCRGCNLAANDICEYTCEGIIWYHTGGYLYIGELHSFKQYTGTKARFETENGLQIVTCFNHHVSDFVFAAKENGFEVRDLTEYFDDGDRSNIPRILTLLLQNNNREKF